MKDIVTFTIGFVCFCVAGVVFGLEARRSGGVGAERSSSRKKSRKAERTASGNEKGTQQRRAAS